MSKTLKPKSIHERAHQYRVMAERLQFHPDRENLPTGATDVVRTAQKALAEAADIVEASNPHVSAELSQVAAPRHRLDPIRRPPQSRPLLSKNAVLVSAERDLEWARQQAAE